MFFERVVVSLVVLACGCSGRGPRDGGLPDTGPRGDGGTLGVPEDHLRLTPDEMRDESTLNLQILSDDVVSVPGIPVDLRIVNLRYFSHEGRDGPWSGVLRIGIPPSITPGLEGAVVMAPQGSINVVEGFDVAINLLAQTAYELGVVVATIPSTSAGHYGLDEIHDISERMTCEAILGEDPGLGPWWDYMALRSRAATAIGVVTGAPTQRVVHHGSSISAYHAWPLPLYDSRFVGLSSTGDTGNFQRQLPRDVVIEDPAYFRKWEDAGCDPLTADPELIATVVSWLDPFFLGDQLAVPVQQIAGSNDASTPPDVIPSMIDALGDRYHLASVPNYGHGTGHFRHGDLLRSFAAHVLSGRPLNRVEFRTLTFADDTIVVSAEVVGDAPVTAVSLWYATTSDPTFLLHDSRADTSDDNYTNATWTEIPMTLSSGLWEASQAIAPGPTHVALFVDSTDEIDGTTSHASSVNELLAR